VLENQDDDHLGVNVILAILGLVLSHNPQTDPHTGSLYHVLRPTNHTEFCFKMKPLFLVINACPYFLAQIIILSHQSVPYRVL
jgi:hypothetical protein